jgi:phospholipid/cholesterol/gamma-HCH transport system substrate-binding protein
VKSQLASAIKDIPVIIQETRQMVGRLNETVSTAERNLQNVESFTRPLGERGQFVVARLEESVSKLDTMMDEMVTFSRSLNSQKGSLGRLINDPDLYDNVTRVVGEIEDISQQLQPIIRDARTFSDRIARHPEVLGVGGALQGSTGTKPLPVFGGR